MSSQRTDGQQPRPRLSAAGRRSALARSAMDVNAVSGSAGKPRRDLLDQPCIAVGIVEGEERRVARALGVGALEPRLRGGRAGRATPRSRRCHG